MCSPHSCGSLSREGHCGSGLDVMHHNGDMSALNQSACSSLQVGNRTRLMPPQNDWRQCSQIWASNGLGHPPHQSRSPLQPRQGGGSANEGRVECPGEVSSQQRIYPCLQEVKSTLILKTQTLTFIYSDVKTQMYEDPDLREVIQQQKGSPVWKVSLTLSVLSLVNLQHMFSFCGVEWSLCRKFSHQRQHETDRGGTGVGHGGGAGGW